MSQTNSTPLRREREEDNISTSTNQQQQNTTSDVVVADAAAAAITTSTSTSQQQKPRVNDRTNGSGLTLMEAIFHSQQQQSQQQENKQNEQLPTRFTGLLKEKYSDFIVREKNPQPLKLINLSATEDCKDPPPPEAPPAYVPPSEEKIKELLSEKLPKEDLECLIEAVLLQQQQQEQEQQQIAENNDNSDAAASSSSKKKNKNKNKNDNQNTTVLLPTPQTEKLQRAKIHQALKECGFPESGTKEGGKILVYLSDMNNNNKGGGGGVFKNKGGRGAYNNYNSGGSNNPAKLGKNVWPTNRGEYLHFTLYKENVETAAALRQLAGKLYVPLRTLQYCGNKDKRAVTTQRVSGRYLSAEALAKLNGMSFGRSSIVRVGDFEYKNDPLQLGKLLGNGFTIVLRRSCCLSEDKNNNNNNNNDSNNKKIPLTSENLQRFEQSLQQHGFANYYGPQRFGTTSISSSEIGKHLIRGDFQTTLTLALKSKVEICPDFQPAFDAYYQQGDIQQAVKLAPYHCSFERDALIALSHNEKDYQAAILALPRPLSMLYCHSVQSLVWNLMAAERLKVAPRVLVGDVVLLNAGDDNSVLNENEGDDDENGDEIAALGENEDNKDNTTTTTTTTDSASAAVAVSTATSETSGNSTTTTTTKDSPLPKTKFVTQEDIDSNRYQLSDILLPIPGPDPDLQFPQNEISGKQKYQQMMSEKVGDGVAESLLLNASKFIEQRFHIHGAYRHFVVVPKNLSLKLIDYNRSDELLIETDFQKMNLDRNPKYVPQQQQQNQNQNQNENQVSNKDNEEISTKFQAVVAEFELPAGCYATSVLRECCVAVSDSRLMPN